MEGIDHLQGARACYDRQEWNAAYAAFDTAEEASALGRSGWRAVADHDGLDVLQRDRGVPRMSRVFGGIHFAHAVEDGWAAGKRVGREVSRALPRVQAIKR